MGQSVNKLDFGARNYDASLGRWMNVDALADHPNQVDKSPYVYTWNNPVNLTDPDGNCPRCLSYGFGFGFRFVFNLGLGSNGVNFNLTASAGVEQRTPNFQAVGFASASVYGGQQLGTSSMTRGLQFDVTAGAYATIGNGIGSAHNFYTLNSNTASPFDNTFDTSFTYGQARTLNSAINAHGDGPGWQTQAIVGLRFGENFSLSSNNDARKYGTGFTNKLLGDNNTDAGWTGGIVLNFGGVEAGYQNFSGYRSDKYPSGGINTKYNQSSFHRSLNKASNFLRLGSITGEYFSDAWFQNFIHNNVSKESTYFYDDKNKVNISGGQQ